MNLSNFGDRKKLPLWKREWSWFGGLTDKPVGTMTLREMAIVWLLATLYGWVILGALGCCYWMVVTVT